MNKSTATLFKKVVTSTFLVVSALVLTVFTIPRAVGANSYQDQINALQTEIESYQQQANEAEARANTLQDEVNSINAQKAVIQVQIDLSQAKYNKLTADIKANEEKMAKMRQVLGDVLAELYVDSDITPLEIIASSKSMSEYMDKQQYQNTVRNKLNSAIKEVKSLRAKLTEQRKDVEKVLSDQKVQRNQLAAKEAERQSLLAKTRGEEASYQSMVSTLRKEKEKAEAALLASVSKGSYKVAPSGYVSAGDVVGAVGSTGLSSGPHLHLEVRRGGSLLNPADYIRVQPIDMPPGYISQYFWNYDPFYVGGRHPGTDFATGQGQPIYAIDSGNLYRGCSDVILRTSGNPYGYVAIVEHSNGTISIYAHMSGGPAACDYNTYY